MVQSWVKDLVEEVCGGAPVKVGDIAKHPSSGKTVKIISGQYWGSHGISNFWEWREVLPDGSLSKKLESGYWR